MSSYFDVKIHLDIQGVKRAIDMFPDRAAKELDKTVGAVAFLIEREGKIRAPVNKSPRVVGGNLRQSIRASKVSAMTHQVKVGVNYGLYVHEGTGIHGYKKRPIIIKNGFGRGIRISNPGQKAQPFLKDAIEGNIEKIEGEFSKAIDRIILN